MIGNYCSYSLHIFGLLLYSYHCSQSQHPIIRACIYIHYNTADSAILAIIPYYKRDKLLKLIIVICAYEY